LLFEKASRIFILSWVLINLLLLPIAVLAEEPLVVSQQIASNEAGSSEFGKVTPLVSIAGNADFLMYQAVNTKDSIYFYYLDGKIKTAIIMIIYAIAALIFFGVYNHNIKLGLGKKASLNISVEAIIIIIFAITILGLGLGFIRGMFTKVTGNLEEIASQEPEPPTPNSGQLVTLSRENIVAGAGEEVVIKVGYFNPGGNATNATANITCTNLNTTNIQTVVNKTIGPRASAIIALIFTIKNDATGGLKLCTISVKDSARNITETKDLTIRVNR